MGVDISTYRAQIGTFSGSTGVGVTHEECLVNFTFGLKTVGAVTFIGMLLVMGGVEQNPGPPKKDTELGERGNSTQEAMAEPDPLVSNSVDIERGSDSYYEKQLNSVFKPIFNFFGLDGRVNNQIQVREARTVVEDNPSSGIQPTEAPMMLLRGLLSMNYRTRDAYTFPLSDSQPQVQHGQRTNRIRARKRVDVSSPSDLFMAMFYCCDPMLQSVLFEKLFLCKCALPFFYKDLFSMNYIVALWPLRSLSAVQTTEGCYTSCNMIDVKTHIISFARLGRPKLSKSTVLNSLISSENTFYNVNCNGGSSKRNISGFCETFFFSPDCESRGKLLKDPTHFLNLRGDLISDFCSEIHTFVNTISDCVVIVIDIQQLEHNYDDYIHVMSKFSSVVILFSDDISNDATIDSFLDRIEELFKSRKHSFLSFALDNDVNISESTKQFSECLSSCVKAYDLKSLFERLSSSTLIPFNDIIKTDEHKNECVVGRKLALGVIQSMKRELNHWAKKNKQESKHLFQHCRLVLTPASCVQTKQISSSLRMIKALRQDKSSTHFDEIDQHHALIRKCKQKQTMNVSESLKAFLQALQEFHESDIHLDYFLSWLRLLLEKETRPFLNELKSKKNHKTYEFIKAKTNKSKKELEELKHELEVLNEDIETISFTVQHLFREMSQICNSIIEIGPDRSIAGVSIDDITKVYANLIFRGESFELIDGDNSYMASFWNKTVFQYIQKQNNVRICKSVSILGLQGTGKSTMLNCMFGLNFETGTGRCTRGINGRLIKMKVSANKHGHLFVIDSEGLRAPERSLTEQYNVDNELATFVTGIGDISLMNVGGENPVELHNVLGVVVYALIRLKHAENALLKRQTCMFVHHCVSDKTAHQNNLDGTNALIKVLDDVTKQAAESEHKEYMDFNDVIQFDAITQMFYLPELWQGEEPVKRVNPAYCKMILHVRQRIFQLLVNESIDLDMTDIGIRTENLWDGILSENFVFSFRNGVEIKLYQNINNAISDKLWNFEKELTFLSLPGFQRKYQKCVKKEDLFLKHASIREDAMEIWELKRKAVQQSIEDLFDTCKDNITAVQWKSPEMHVVNRRFEDIMVAAKSQLYSYYTIQLLNIETSTITEERRTQLEIKCQEVAEKLKVERREKDIEDSLIEDSFTTLWENFEKDIRQQLTVKKHPDLDKMFISKLHQMFFEDTIHLEEHLKDFTALESLHHVLIDKPEVQPLVQYVESLVNGLDETIELSEIMVEDFIRKFKAKWLECFQTTDHTWTKKFQIYILVECCRFALYHFSDHNKRFRKNQGIDSYIRQYRQKIYLSFKVTIGGKQKETQISKSLCSTILSCLNKAVRKTIEKKVENALETELRMPKASLIREICKFLANQADGQTAFDDYISYLRAPEFFGKKWFIIRCEQILFPEVNDNKSFKAISERSIDRVFRHVIKSVNEIRNSSETSIRLQKAVDLFSERFEMLEIDSTEIEQVCSSEMNERVNVKDLAKYIECEFCIEKDSLTKFFRLVTVNTIETFINPQYDAMFKHLWGCFEKCPFCKEPCTLKNHSVEFFKHRCQQHRILGCLGVNTGRGRFFRNPCDSSISNNSEWFDCRTVNYECKKHQDHGNESHHYFQGYKSLFPDWDIIPSSDARESSTYWKWFMYKFRERLSDYYGCASDSIPDNWSQISKQEAIHSYRHDFSEDISILEQELERLKKILAER